MAWADDDAFLLRLAEGRGLLRDLDEATLQLIRDSIGEDADLGDETAMGELPWSGEEGFSVAGDTTTCGHGLDMLDRSAPPPSMSAAKRPSGSNTHNRARGPLPAWRGGQHHPANESGAPASACHRRSVTGSPG